MGSFSIGHWLILLAIVILVFGTKKLGTIGTDLGRAVKGFKDGVKGEGKDSSTHMPGQAAIDVESKAATRH